MCCGICQGCFLSCRIFELRFFDYFDGKPRVGGFGLLALGFALRGIVAFDVDEGDVVVSPEYLKVGVVTDAAADIEHRLSEEANDFAGAL